MAERINVGDVRNKTGTFFVFILDDKALYL